MVLFATIYLSLMGREGLREVNELASDGAHYLHDELLRTGRFTDAFPGKPFLKELTLHTDMDVDALNKRLLDNGIMGGLNLGNGMVEFAVTEKRTKAEIDNLVKS